MRARTFCFLMAALLFIPCVCLAQTQRETVTPEDIAPFLGSWTGTHEECSSAANCDSRNVRMNIMKDKVEYTLSSADAGFNRYSKSSKGPSTKTYPSEFRKKNGVTTFSFTTSSGNEIEFNVTGGRLMGQGTGGRFDVKYSLKRAGN